MQHAGHGLLQHALRRANHPETGREAAAHDRWAAVAVEIDHVDRALRIGRRRREQVLMDGHRRRSPYQRDGGNPVFVTSGGVECDQRAHGWPIRRAWPTPNASSKATTQSAMASIEASGAPPDFPCPGRSTASTENS